MLGLPPVVVGLAAYLLLSRSGPLGALGFLYTPVAMIIVQTVLAIPIVTAIVHRAAAELWAGYGEGFLMAGATRLEIIPQLLMLGRAQVLTALLAGLGRTISEVGAIIIVGGNIAGATRTMTTAIALQTSMGNLPVALPGTGADYHQPRFERRGVSYRREKQVMKKHTLISLAFTAVFTLLTGISGSYADQPYFVLASTTSVENSGLLAHILPLFTGESGVSVRVVALGTGQALDTARRGDADLVLVHDPEAETKFISEGHGINRREVAWNDFVVVGPAADPAKIKGDRDILAGLRAIWSSNAPFVSRGDQSGTDALEKRLWKAADLDIGKATSSRISAAVWAPPSTRRRRSMPTTLTGRGTWLSFRNRRNMVILLEGDGAPSTVRRNRA